MKIIKTKTITNTKQNNPAIATVENFGVFIKAINFPFSGLARYNKTFSSRYEEKH